ncbi:MAG: hypothetical protein K1060chlam2_00308 [Chlamydiae bacterium]|nr:hypothetical protein [Chlamydiota bacterium]
MRISLLALLLALSISGCYQVSSDGDGDFRTVPVTNNPNLTPHREMGGMSVMPY